MTRKQAGGVIVFRPSLTAVNGKDVLRMQTIKNWFGIETAYRFEWNDVRCGITLLNVVLIMLFGLQVSWFGLAIALFGVCKDLSQHRHINDVMMHLSSVVLNLYFLSLLYK